MGCVGEFYEVGVVVVFLCMFVFLYVNGVIVLIDGGFIVYGFILFKL